MKKEVERHCDVVVKGNKKYRLYIEEAIDKFMEYIDSYHKQGFVDFIQVNVYFKEKSVKNE